MNNLFRRKKLPAWPNPQLSIGRQIDDIDIQGVNCYEAIGPACDAFDEVRSKIQELIFVNKEDIERGERPRGVGLGIFMIGTEPLLTTPTIIISSKSKRQRRMIKALIKSEKVLKGFPAIRLETLHESPGILNAITDSSLASMRDVFSSQLQMHWTEKIEQVAGVHTRCGSQICLGKSSSTMGGVIALSTSKQTIHCGMTAGHLGWEKFHEDEDDEVLDCSPAKQLAFDEDSDFDIEESELDQLTSKASITTFQDTSDVSLSSSSNDSEHPTGSLKDTVQQIEAISSSDNMQKSDSGISVLHGLDYMLFPVGIPEDYSGNTIHTGEDPDNCSLLQTQNIIYNNSGGPICTSTSATGLVKGEISRSPYLIKFAGWHDFQEVWSADLGRKTSMGDSGLWVVDTATGDLYGHIVGGRPNGSMAYVLPAHKIFSDIQTTTNWKVTLPKVTTPRQDLSHTHTLNVATKLVVDPADDTETAKRKPPPVARTPRLVVADGPVRVQEQKSNIPSRRPVKKRWEPDSGIGSEDSSAMRIHISASKTIVQTPGHHAQQSANLQHNIRAMQEALDAANERIRQYEIGTAKLNAQLTDSNKENRLLKKEEIRTT